MAVQRCTLITRSRSVAVLSLVLALNIAARTQTQTSSPIAPGGTATRPGSLQDSGPLGYWTDMEAQARAGGFLLGKVAVKGEQLIWEPIPIAVTCNGSVEYTTQTDSKNNFAISPKSMRGAVSLQDDAQRQMESHLEGCTVQVVLSGFHSSSVTITRRNLRDDPNLGTIMIDRLDGATGTAISSLSTTVPPKAIKYFEKAHSDLMDHKLDNAQNNLGKAVQIAPDFADAWYQLGRLQLESNPQLSRDSFSKAVAADPKFLAPRQQLMALDVQAGKWQDVVDNNLSTLQLDPAGTAQDWNYDALANLQLGKVDRAKASALRSLAMDPSHTVQNTEQLLAVILARKKDYAAAIEHLRHCLTYLPSGPNADLVKQQIEQLQHLQLPPS